MRPAISEIQRGAHSRGRSKTPLALLVPTAPKRKQSTKRLQRVECRLGSTPGQIAKQASHLGAKWSAEDWKRFLVWQFAKEVGISTGKLVPSLDGTGIVQLGLQTRKFTKDEASQFTEWLIAWATQNGVNIEQ